MFRYLLLFIGLFFTAKNVNSQTGDSIRNYQYVFDFFKANNALKRLSNTAVSFQFTYRLSDNPNVVVDSMNASYHLDKGMMRGTMGNLIFLRNRNYSVTVNPADSEIIIGNTGAGVDAFQINIFDSIFRTSNVTGIDIVQAENGDKTLSLTFKPYSYYRDYAITYTSAYLIKKIHLEFLDMDYDENGNPPPAGRKKIMDVAYNDYHSENYDLSNFGEEQFLRKDEYGNWKGVGMYANFEVMVTQPGL